MDGDATVVHLTVSGSYTGPSDRRLKRDITPLRNNLDGITKLRGVYFKWSENHPQKEKVGDRRHAGLIAQDVEAVFPDLVSKVFNEDYLGVNYLELIPVLVEAIRELNDNHIELLGDFNALNTKFSKLEKMVQTLLM